MTEQVILNSITLKKRFVRDNNLSIAVLDNPYFMQRVEGLRGAPWYAREKWQLFCKELSRFANEQQYCEYYNKVKDDAINYIKIIFSL